MLMSVRQKIYPECYCYSHWIHEDFGNQKKKLYDALRVYMYLMSIFKANVFLPSARSNEELALFSLKNITLII